MRTDQLARRVTKNTTWLVSGAVSALVAVLARQAPSGDALADMAWSVLAAVVASMIVGRAVKAWRPVMAMGPRTAVTVGVVTGIFFLRLPGPFGAETVVCVLVLMALAVYGEVRKPKKRRRWRTRTKRRVRLAVGLLAVGFGLAFASSVSVARQMQGSLVQAAGLASAGAEDFRVLEFERGTNKLRQSVASLQQFETVTGSLRGRLMGLMPVLGHQRTYAQTVVKQMRDLASRAITMVELGPIDRLSLRVGTADPVKVDGLTRPVTDLVATSEGLLRAVSGASPWVFGELATSFDEMATAARGYAGTFDTVMQFVTNSPWTMGVTEPRTYVVNVVSHDQVSGAGGVPTATGVMSVRKGTMMLDFSPRRNPDPDGQARRVFTQTVDYPRAAETAWSVYSQALGVNVDGIFHVDASALADMVGLVGEVRVGRGEDATRLTAESTVAALARGTDAGVVADAISKRLTAIDPLPMTTVAQAWARAVANGNVKMWFTDYTARQLVLKMKADGALGEPASIADLAVFTTDVEDLSGSTSGGGETVGGDSTKDRGGWKVRREVTYGATVADDGATTATVSVTVINDGATTRTVSTQLFSLLQCQATSNGESIVMTSGRQAAWVVHSVQVPVATKGSTTVEFSCTGSTLEQGVDLEIPRIRGQASANGEKWTVTVKGRGTTFELKDTVNGNVWVALGSK